MDDYGSAGGAGGGGGAEVGVVLDAYAGYRCTMIKNLMTAWHDMTCNDM